MEAIILTTLELLQKPAVAVFIICLVALVVAGMSVYGMTVAVKKQGKQ